LSTNKKRTKMSSTTIAFYKQKLDQYFEFFNTQNLDGVLDMLDDSLVVEFQGTKNGKAEAKPAYVADFAKEKSVTSKLISESEDDNTVNIRVELHLLPDNLSLDVTYTFAKSHQRMTHHFIHSVAPLPH